MVFVTIFNFILPATQHFGLCRPLASRWDTRITDKQCWTQKVRIGIAYTQAISNIITDLLYATAPIVYIRSVQLNRRTQWSVRAVFLMSLLYVEFPPSALECTNELHHSCTTISALKLWDFQRIQNLKEAYYESVTLSIWSMSEVTIGIIVANLPPLRKTFDRIFKHVLPSTGSNNVLSLNKYGGNKFESYNLPTYRSQTARHTNDNESDKAILEELEAENGQNGIMKTTKISIGSAK